LLLIRGYAFNSSADFEIVRDIKEKHGYIAYDINRERQLDRETCTVNRDYILPNRKIIRIGWERFEAGECLFNPSMVDVEKPGIHELIFDTINAAPIDTRKSLYSSILLTGGSTMFPGFPTWVHKELKDKFMRDVAKGRKFEDIGIDIKIIDPFSRKHSVFIGGSIFTSVMKEGDWISKK
jgi:actin-related protein 2